MKMWGADWWDALSAIGTVGAVVVALLLAWFERRRARRSERELEVQRRGQLEVGRRAVAEMVSAWVEITMVSSSTGDHYVRRATLHVDNQSNEPVYNASVCVGIPGEAQDWIPVGALAAPLPLPVVAARSGQTWDITLPLMACSSDIGGLSQHASAALAFSDPSGQRWVRSFDGHLRRSSEGDASLFDLDPSHGELQMGDVENLFNPVPLVVAFLAGISSPKREDQELAKSLLDPEEDAWARMTPNEWVELSRRLASLGVAAHVQYPAPRVAYVKALTDEAANTRRQGGAGYVTVPVQVFTLRFIKNLGWRIFAIGAAVRADAIHFPERDLEEDVRGDC